MKSSSQQSVASSQNPNKPKKRIAFTGEILSLNSKQLKRFRKQVAIIFADYRTKRFAEEAAGRVIRNLKLVATRKTVR